MITGITNFPKSCAEVLKKIRKITVKGPGKYFYSFPVRTNNSVSANPMRDVTIYQTLLVLSSSSIE